MLPPDSKRLAPMNSASDTTPENPALPGVHHPSADPSAYGVPNSLPTTPSLANILHAFRRCWRIAIPLALLAACVGVGIAWFLFPPQYTSMVVFRIQSRPSLGILEDDTNFASVQKAQLSIIKSYDVLSEAIQKSRVSELYGVHYSAPTLSKKLSAGFVEGPEILDVQLSGDHPEALAALLNALGEVYPLKVNSADETRLRNRIELLRRKIAMNHGRRDPDRPASLAEQLFDKRVELQEAEKKAGIDNTETTRKKFDQAQEVLRRRQDDYSHMYRQRLGLEEQLYSKQQRLRFPETPKVSEEEAEDILRADPAYQALLTRLSDKQKEIRTYRNTLTVAGFEAKRPQLEREVQKIDEDRMVLINQARKKLGVRLLEKQADSIKREIVEVKEKIDQSKKLELALETEVRRLNMQVDELRAGGPKAPPEVEALRDQVLQLEREMRRVGEELAVLQGSQPLPPRVTQHTEAYIPTEKEYLRPIKYAVAGGVVSFGFVLCGLCFLEARKARVSASDDISQSLGMPVVGTLPAFPTTGRAKPGQTQAMNGLDSQFGMTESVDAIRTMLLHAPRVDGARVVMVTSATGGEGKTTLASHLAASLARAWRKTLLIDGDLRNPAQHIQFDQSVEPGLCEALRGEVEFEDVIKPTHISRLWLVPAGKIDAHALQALTQEGITSVFDALKEMYDFIVIDTSPVLPVPDALLFGKHADAVLLSVMKDHSRMPAVSQAYHRLDALGIRVLGAVVIGEKTETYGHAVQYPTT